MTMATDDNDSRFDNFRAVERDDALARAVATSPPDWPASDYRVPRDHDLDLDFTGWLLGEGEWNSNTAVPSRGRSAKTRIYVTRGGRLVTESAYYGEHTRLERTEAAVHESIHEALMALTDEAGLLPRSAKVAWTQACTKWPVLEGQDVERID